MYFLIEARYKPLTCRTKIKAMNAILANLVTNQQDIDIEDGSKKRKILMSQTSSIPHENSTMTQARNFFNATCKRHMTTTSNWVQGLGDN